MFPKRDWKKSLAVGWLRVFWRPGWKISWMKIPVRWFLSNETKSLWTGKLFWKMNILMQSSIQVQRRFCCIKKSKIWQIMPLYTIHCKKTRVTRKKKQWCTSIDSCVAQNHLTKRLPVMLSINCSSLTSATTWEMLDVTSWIKNWDFLPIRLFGCWPKKIWSRLSNIWSSCWMPVQM